MHEVLVFLLVITFVLHNANGDKMGWGSRGKPVVDRGRKFSRDIDNIEPYLSSLQYLNISSSAKANPIAVTKDGLLRGFTMTTVTSRPIAAFQRIPYGQPPIGSLRFRDPVKNRPWSGIKDAIARSPQCIQMDFFQNMAVHGEEDCLYLNVYTPQIPQFQNLNKKLAVMVFFHGGALFFGAGSLYGPAYMLDRDVVLVTVDYRLGPFGFLSTGDDASPGNQGLKDQVLALRWVKENIEAFGGDPNSVTIVGQSAGAVSVQHHFVSPLSRGLFHRGISQTGASTCYWSIAENSVESAKRVGEFLNCRGNSRQMIDCLRRVDAKKLVRVQLNFLEWSLFPHRVFLPVIEHNYPGAFLTELPEETYRQHRAARVPWLTGLNRDEMSSITSQLILDHNAIADVNNDWESVGPLLLSIQNGTGNDVEIVNRVWNLYFGSRNHEFSFRTRYNFVEMLGDRNYVICGLEAMRLHSRYTDQPVYAYHFSYEGKNSIVELNGQDPKDWGVTHWNDLIYLYNNTDYYQSLKPGDEDFKMSQIMTSFWSNFATHSRPYLNTGGQLVDVWKPIPRSNNEFSPLQMLDLNLKPRMINDPFTKRYNFWKSLRLVD